MTRHNIIIKHGEIWFQFMSIKLYNVGIYQFRINYLAKAILKATFNMMLTMACIEYGDVCAMRTTKKYQFKLSRCLVSALTKLYSLPFL